MILSMMSGVSVNDKYNELTRRKIDIWHFLEEVYGHDQFRHPMPDDVAVDFYTKDDEGFFKKLSKYIEEWE